MIRDRRALLVALLGGVLVFGLLGSWVMTGWDNAKARAVAIEEEAWWGTFTEAADLADELGRALEKVRVGEDSRPYYEYQNLYHDPRGATVGLSVIPSPLASRTADPLIRAHYQITPDGELSIPPVNEELPELSNPVALAANVAVLTELRESRLALGADRVKEAPKVAVVTRPRRPRRKKTAGPTTAKPTPQPQLAQAQGPPQQVQRFEPEVFSQNANANQIFQENQYSQTSPVKAKPRRRATPRKEKAKPIEIRIASFSFDTAMIGDRAHMVATRLVETPEGTLAQGFVVARSAVDEWLAARSDGGARLVSPLEADTLLTASTVSGLDEWRVIVDNEGAIGDARATAEAVRTRFWTWFLIAAALALVVLILVVWVVYRAERLAKERSQFAAAAAHELRTPLAGLQLYGEMLADGLGDPSQKQNYAQRISDEAARLGRVVNNVLGFTQLERGALAVDAQPGDVVAATRKAIERSRKALEDAGMTVTLSAPERSLARIDDDAHGRIIGNLLDNAEKYSRGHSEREVAVRVRETEEWVIVSVSDSGHGISDRARGRIFKPFARDVDADGAAGLGLGLPLARTLARDQGGDLVCLPSDGQGARFELSLRRLLT